MALRRNDITDSGAVLWVDECRADPDGVPDFDTPKAHQERRIAVPPFLAGRLVEHLAEHVGPEADAYLFTGRTGQGLRYGSWKRWKFDPAVAAAGLSGITPHDLRATHGSWVADAHGVMAAASRLGHSNANVTTRHYARVIDGKDAQIAADLELFRDAGSVTDTDGSSEDVARRSHDGGSASGRRSQTRRRRGA